jgi:hypothetical protein
MERNLVLAEPIGDLRDIKNVKAGELIMAERCLKRLFFFSVDIMIKFIEDNSHYIIDRGNLGLFLTALILSNTEYTDEFKDKSGLYLRALKVGLFQNLEHKRRILELYPEFESVSLPPTFYERFFGKSTHT